MKFSESLEITPRTSQLETLTQVVSDTADTFWYLPYMQCLLLPWHSWTWRRFLTLHPSEGYFGRGCFAHPCVPTEVLLHQTKAVQTTFNRGWPSGQQFLASVVPPRAQLLWFRRGTPHERGSSSARTGWLQAVRSPPPPLPAAAKRGSCPAVAYLSGGQLNKRPRSTELRRACRWKSEGTPHPELRGSRLQAAEKLWQRGISDLCPPGVLQHAAASRRWDLPKQPRGREPQRSMTWARPPQIKA